MVPSTLAAVTAICLAQAAAAQGPTLPAGASPKRLIAVGDHVKVRASPTADGPLKGYLFKNMVVEVLERGAQPELVGDRTDYWYRVARGNLSGWSFGSFFSATIPARTLDTYDVPNLDAWWGNRFGWSTEYYENGAPPPKALQKLEMDDYRGLILMASSDSYGEYTRAAWTALLSTLYPFLKKHADDPRWQYFRDRVWDPDFVGVMASRHGGDGLAEALPKGMLEDPAFKAKVCAKAGAKLPACVQQGPAAPR